MEPRTDWAYLSFGLMCKNKNANFQLNLQKCQIYLWYEGQFEMKISKKIPKYMYQQKPQFRCSFLTAKQELMLVLNGQNFCLVFVVILSFY